MKCFHCQAKLQRGLTTFTDSKNGYVIMLHDVPAWVCPQCGESLFDNASVRGIQEVVRSLDEGVEKLRRAA
ncbi:MAG: type II toxin-antitoxin system MqsA family antitoxin [Armatimonadetes bacterium]|nr:type II toxin-antitoxin system MqsA family antitoxin [Armatimonadota bacterium]